MHVQDRSHDFAVYSSDNAYESPPDEMEPEMVGLMNRVTLGPPDGDLYASIPDDIGHPDIRMTGNVAKHTNDYTCQPCQTDVVFQSEGPHAEYRKGKTERGGLQTTKRMEAVALGPLDGDSYSSIPNRPALPNLLSVIDIDTDLSTYESPPDHPPQPISRRLEADVLSPLDGDSYTSVPSRAAVRNTSVTSTPKSMTQTDPYAALSDPDPYQPVGLTSGDKGRHEQPAFLVTRNEEAMALGPIDGDSYTSIPNRMIFTDSVFDTITELFADNAYQPPSDQVTSGSAGCYTDVGGERFTRRSGIDDDASGKCAKTFYSSISRPPGLSESGSTNDMTDSPSHCTSGTLTDHNISLTKGISQESLGKEKVSDPLSCQITDLDGQSPPDGDLYATSSKRPHCPKQNTMRDPNKKASTSSSSQCADNTSCRPLNDSMETPEEMELRGASSSEMQEQFQREPVGSDSYASIYKASSNTRKLCEDSSEDLPNLAHSRENCLLELSPISGDMYACIPELSSAAPSFLLTPDDDIKPSLQNSDLSRDNSHELHGRENDTGYPKNKGPLPLDPSNRDIIASIPGLDSVPNIDPYESIPDPLPSRVSDKETAHKEANVLGTTSGMHDPFRSPRDDLYASIPE